MAKKKKSLSSVFSRAQKFLGENRPSSNQNPFVIMPEGEYRLHIYADPTNPAFFRFRVQHKVTIGGQTLKLISPRLARQANEEIEDIGYDESPLDDRIEELMSGGAEDRALAKRIQITEFVVFYGRIEWEEPPTSSDATEGLIMCTMSDFGRLIRAATDELDDFELEPDTKLVFDIEREGWDINEAEFAGIEDMTKSEIAFVEGSPSLKSRVEPLPIDELKKRLDEASEGRKNASSRGRRRRMKGAEVDEVEDEDEELEEEEEEVEEKPKRKLGRLKRKVKVEEPEDDDEDDDDEDDEEVEEKPKRKKKRVLSKRKKSAIADELLDELEED